MKDLFREQWWLFAGMAIFLVCNVICHLAVAYYMMKIVKESAELERGKMNYLKSWIEEYIKEENKIINTAVYVEKKLQQFCIGKFTMIQIKHISGQAVLLMIFFAAMGACLGIIKGKTLGQILPYYICSLLGLYIHFSLSGFINIEENKKRIQMNVVDFLENKNPYYYLRTAEKEEKEVEEIKEFFGEAEDLELKEIIREILA